MVGTGTFSSVYHALDRNGHDVALKKLFWTNDPERVLREIEVLLKFHHPNIARIIGAYRNSDEFTIVMDFYPHIPFRSLLPIFSSHLIKDYMYGLLSAIDCIHKGGFIHRDIKPANFLFNPETGKGVLVDFGLSENDNYEQRKSQEQIPIVSKEDLLKDIKYPMMCMKRKKKMTGSRAGTRGFRAPEVLLAVKNQSQKIDIWSAGVIFLSILTKRYPFFKSPDDQTAICELAAVFGNVRMNNAIQQLHRLVLFPDEHPGFELQELIHKLNPSIDSLQIEDTAYDLLNKLLEPAVDLRITAAQALVHPYFKDYHCL